MNNINYYVDASSIVTNCKLGENTRIYKCAQVKDSAFGENCRVGDFCDIQDSVFGNRVIVNRYCEIYDCTMGNYSLCNRLNTFHHVDNGKFCMISWRVSLGGDNHEYKHLTTHTFPYNYNYGFTQDKELLIQHIQRDRIHEPCTVGNDVWIAAGATINRNVAVGNGAVIAAGAVVTKDVPAYAVVAGVPARVIKMRFDDNTIEKLEELRWWDLPDDVIREAVSLFQRDFGSAELEKLEYICYESRRD